MPEKIIVTELDKTKRFTADAFDAVRKAVAKTCLDCEADAKRRITAQNAIDAGAARASIYSSTPLRSNYAERTAQALSEAAKGSRKLRRRKVKGGVRKVKMLAEVKPQDALEGVVSVGVDYGIVIENGAVRKNVSIPARPFLLPAAETMENVFVTAVERAFNEAVDRL